MKSRAELEIVEQVVFGDDGAIETTGEPVETSFSDWGVKVDLHERQTRYEEPRATRFGVDDRAVTKTAESEQETLLTDVADGQVTLAGEEAQPVNKWTTEN